uniref:Novel immune-type receptor 10a n=1 Tax=Sinocyclocheilus rhinocerous TaxID=307959 RepID=A0A673MZI8_9TELE
MFSTANIQTHPGQSVTMWCPHNIHVTGNLYWFKQSDSAVPITIVHMLYTERLQKVEPNYFNSFTNDCIVMDQFSKSTTLTIKQVKISDSGFYFCGATGYHMKFGTGTRLEVKGFIIIISTLLKIMSNDPCLLRSVLETFISN